MKSFQEHPQSLLLTDSIRPVLDALHPNGRAEREKQQADRLAARLRELGVDPDSL